MIGSEKNRRDIAANWFQVDPRTDYCLVRQIGYHENEVDATLTIENLSTPSTTRRPLVDDTLIKRIISYVKFNSVGSLGFLKQLEQDGVFNTLKNYDYSNQGGMKNQVFQQGLYDIPANQAMIVSFKVPEPCAYWSIMTTNRLWQTNETVYTQGHLNGSVDRADSDGITRIVLSHCDPGIDNWIDLSGIEKGYVLIRWLQCQAPETATRLLPLTEIEHFMPVDTRRVTPEQRQVAILKRALARQRRRYW